MTFLAWRRALLPILLIRLASPLAAQLAEPVLVEDFSPGSRPLEFLPEGLTEIGGLLYFAGHDPQHGVEPWVSDGTAAGTRRLVDLCPGPCSSKPAFFTGVGDRVLFFTIDSFTLYALHQGKIEAIGREIGDGRDLVTLGDIAFLRFGMDGEYMMRTDGTVADTRRTQEFCAAPSCYSPRYAKVGEVIYINQGGKLFALHAEGDRRELGYGFASASDFVATGAGKVVFRGCANAENCRAFATDGESAAATVALEPEAGGVLTFDPTSLVAWRGRVYFANAAGQLVSTDGSPQGTRPEPFAGGFRPKPLAATSAALLYTTRAYADPTLSILYARSSLGGEDLELTELGNLALFGPRQPAGEKIFFTRNQELLATDGTLAGTAPLAQFSLLSEGSAYQGGKFVFGLDKAGQEGPGIFTSDGTSDGTRRFELAQRRPNGTAASPHRLGSSLYSYLGFESGERQDNLYRIDPETFAATPADSRPLGNIAAGRNVLYAGQPGAAARLIAVKENSVEDLMPGVVVNPAVADDDHLFFTDDQPGQKLFESDGTAAGTRLLFDLDPGHLPQCNAHICQPIYPDGITPRGDRVFFVAEAGDGHRDGALFAYRRGTGATPVEIPFAGRAVGPLTPAPGGRVAFVMLDPAGPGSRMRLWQSDGTLAGTRVFFTLPGFVRPHLYAVAGQRLYFAVVDSPSQLYVSDLTAGGTTLLIENFGQQINALQAAGDHLYFIGKPATGIAAELGYSDGTPAGTGWLDLVPGKDGARPTDPFLLDDRRLVFAATADEAGHELWISDGSPAGTRRLTDLAPGADASAPSSFAQVGNRLFFVASDGVAGFEPWALDLPAAAEACPEDLLCLGGGRFEVAVEGLANGAPSGVPFQGSRVFAAADSGVFSFFSPNNWEMLVKVLDGCGINQNFWVYASAATDQPYQLTVRDRWSGRSKTYRSSGTSRPILDGAAFETCAAPLQPPAYLPSPTGGAPAEICADDPAALCLGPAGRYRVSLDWQTAEDDGEALPVPLGSADSGLFTFFSPDNWEVMVKLLDGCAINGKHWVFAAGTTDVGWTLRVTDRLTGNFETYENQLGQPSRTVADIEAFACD